MGITDIFGGGGSSGQASSQAEEIQKEIKAEIQDTLEHVEELEGYEDDFWNHENSLPSESELKQVLDNVKAVTGKLGDRERDIRDKMNEMNSVAQTEKNQAVATWRHRNKGVTENVLNALEQVREELREDSREFKKMIEAEDKHNSDVAGEIATELRKHNQKEEGQLHKIESGLNNWNDTYN